jgi:membrane associated rhomboid family serine protease
MIFPYADDQVKGGATPFFSYGFILLNALLFLYEASLEPRALEQFVITWGAIPAEIMAGEDYLTLLSSMFLHGGWAHLLGNMLYLYIFADNIEATIGNLPFLVFYLLGGLAAHFTHIFFYPGSVIPTVGASGAISAVMGAYLVMFPKSQIRFLFFFLFRFSVPAILFLVFWIAQQYFAGSLALEADTTNADAGQVAWWAHIGGFAFGVAAGIYFRLRFPPPSPQPPHDTFPYFPQRRRHL